MALFLTFQTLRCYDALRKAQILTFQKVSILYLLLFSWSSQQVCIAISSEEQFILKPVHYHLVAAIEY